MKRTIPKSRRSVLACVLGLLVASAQAAPVAQPAVKIPVSPDAQVRVALSNSEPNMLVVPGDKVVAIDSAQGMFINGNQKGATGVANGGVILMTAQTKPFTFYVRTAGGLTVSVIGVPQKRDGRVLQLISDMPAKSAVAKRWEQSLPYPRLLMSIHKAMLQGEMPPGFSPAPDTALPAFHLPPVYRLSVENMWNGGALRVYQLRLHNTTAQPQALSEHLFQHAGVRSVLIQPYSNTLLPHAAATVWLIASNEVNHG